MVQSAGRQLTFGEHLQFVYTRLKNLSGTQSTWLFYLHLYPFSVYPYKIVCPSHRTWNKAGDFHFQFEFMIYGEYHILCSPCLLIVLVYLTILIFRGRLSFCLSF